MMTLLATEPIGRPRLRSVLPERMTAPPRSSTRARLSVTGIHAAFKGGKHSWKRLTRSTAAPRSSDRSPSLEPLQEPLEPGAVGLDEAGDGLVDEIHRRRLAAPVDAQLDGLVGHRAPGRGDGPREGSPLGIDVVGLAAVDHGQGVLADPERIGGGVDRRHRCQLVLQLRLQLLAQAGRERRRLLGPPEQGDERLLRGGEDGGRGHDGNGTEGVSRRTGTVARGRLAPLSARGCHGSRLGPCLVLSGRWPRRSSSQPLRAPRRPVTAGRTAVGPPHAGWRSAGYGGGSWRWYPWRSSSLSG